MARAKFAGFPSEAGLTLEEAVQVGAAAALDERLAEQAALEDAEAHEAHEGEPAPYFGETTPDDAGLWGRLLAEAGGDALEALFRMCFAKNVMYHEKLAKSFALSDDPAVKAAMPAPYFDAIKADPKLARVTFLSQIKRENFEKAYSDDLSALALTDEDRKNRQQILGIVSYDPFAKEPAEDKPQMYRDLAGLLTDAMRRDIPKRNAAIEIVHDYITVTRYQRRLAELEASERDDDETRDRIDNCIKMISKMQDTINKIAKENGFSSGKSIGTNGRGGLAEVMNIVEERGYDKGAANLYDIETSKAIEQVAEISTRAMLNQVNLSGTDYAEILTNQCKAVREYRMAALRAEEAARLAQEKLEKASLLKEYRMELLEKGIDLNDVTEMINREIRMVDGDGR